MWREPSKGGYWGRLLRAVCCATADRGAGATSRSSSTASTCAAACLLQRAGCVLEDMEGAVMVLAHCTRGLGSRTHQAEAGPKAAARPARFRQAGRWLGGDQRTAEHAHAQRRSTHICDAESTPSCPPHRLLGAITSQSGPGSEAKKVGACLEPEAGAWAAHSPFLVPFHPLTSDTLLKPQPHTQQQRVGAQRTTAPTDPCRCLLQQPAQHHPADCHRSAARGPQQA